MEEMLRAPCSTCPPFFDAIRQIMGALQNNRVFYDCANKNMNQYGGLYIWEYTFSIFAKKLFFFKK